MLAKFGFGEKCISWIQECVSTARILILVNGSPTKEFNPQKGLRQGDSLSLFLFNLVVEALNILLQRAMELRLLKGVSVGANDEVKLSHLQFADDSLLFCEVELLEVLNLKRILRCFEVASGLKINYHKSVVCGIGISGSALTEFAFLLNCKTQNLPLKHQGLPLGANPRRKKTWKPIVAKVKLRQAGWKMRLLSYVGRLTLMKAVLSSIPVYYLSLFKLTKGIAKELDKIQASFLWGGPDLKRKIHLVKWSEVTKSIKQGGLGVRRIRDANVCLLLKRWWRFASELVSLWYKVICSKYRFLGGKWVPNPSLNTLSSYIWNGIVAAGEQNQSLSLFYASNLQLKVGNGYHISFWVDPWCGNLCLKDEFPRLFSLSLQNDGLLKNFVEVFGATKNWLVTCRRPLFVWEKNELLRLYGIVGSAPSLQLETQDSAVWRAAKLGQSFVSNLYNYTNSAYGGNESFSRLVWIKNLWSMFSCSAYLFEEYGQVFCSGYPWRKAELRIWRAIPLVTLWSIWKHRNDCSFHQNMQQLQELILTMLAFWLKAASKELYFSISDFLYNISGVRQGLL
ncbi:uncharacterized protein LOC114305894 [Camellia sinensis]|uniref:uncharacterized protein LOC114305894 n=1 Tax=Camellia sinensis TaxID=4442 RepID=UPI0010364081|nr:uncharacterized protein LOC114305894 [Camellia sinensis]